MKYAFDELVIEVTRRCNMGCAHCLRGEAENIDVSFNKLSKLASVADNIGQVCFTGGEPSLAVMEMRFFRELCERRGIPVYGFYVVTNGKEVTKEFLMEMLSWYAYCISCGADAESCGLALSKDQFHEKIPAKNEQLLRGLAFFRHHFPGAYILIFLLWKFPADRLFSARALSNDQLSIAAGKSAEFLQGMKMLPCIFT